MVMRLPADPVATNEPQDKALYALNSSVCPGVSTSASVITTPVAACTTNSGECRTPVQVKDLHSVNELGNKTPCPAESKE